MGGAAEELKQKLSQRIDAVSRKLDLLKKDLSDLHAGDRAALSERRNDIRARLDQKKSLEQTLQSKIAEWQGEKRERAVDAITSWEQRREIEKLQAHAQRAADAAVDMVNVAAHDLEEVEHAVLEALAARMDADQALAPA